MKRLPLAVLGFACAMASLQGDPISFDFESLPPTYFGVGNHPGTLSSIAVASGGLTLTVTRFGGSRFDLVSNMGTEAGKPAGWGSVSLDPFAVTHSSSFWIFDFSQPITSFSIQFGDYGGDSDSELMLLFDGPAGTGNTIGIVNGFYGQALPAFGSTFIAVPGARSVDIMGSSNVQGLENSVYLDNIAVTVAVPEPDSLLLLAIGSVTLLFVYLRKRRFVA